MIKFTGPSSGSIGGGRHAFATLGALGAMAALLTLQPSTAVAQTQTNQPPAASSDSSTNSWSFYAGIFGYVVPHSRDYANLDCTADRDWLHLEARYNYEALETASLWVGYNFNFGSKLQVGITPMLGGVFGNLTGIAPGCNLSASYWKISLSTQAEYVVDTGNSANDFFYTWSELSYAPVDWFRAGLVIQRTKAYKSDLDIQRGFLVGATYKQVSFTTYVFNLGWTDPTVVLAMGLDF